MCAFVIVILLLVFVSLLHRILMNIAIDVNIWLFSGIQAESGADDLNIVLGYILIFALYHEHNSFGGTGVRPV